MLHTTIQNASWRYLEKNNDFVKRIFLPLSSPFLNPAEHLWREGKARLYRMFRLLARSYFRRKVILVYESLEITFEPRYLVS